MNDIVQRLRDIADELEVLQTEGQPATVSDPEEAACWQKDFDEKHGYFKEIAESNDFKSIWSLYETYPFDAAEIPYPNARKVRYTMHWGDRPIDVCIKGIGTWVDLWRAADEAIKLSGDDHHVFIEGFDDKGDTLVLWTGS